jgi:hypothetical protein
MTMADSLSTLTRSQSQQPGTQDTAPQPNARPSSTRCSTGHSDNLAAVDSESDDSSDVDENGNAWDRVENNRDRAENNEDRDDDCENYEEESAGVHIPLSLAAMLDDLEWKFEEVPSGTEYKLKQTFYGGTSRRLGRAIADSFKMPMECCLGVCGGLSVAFVRRLAAESSDYFHLAIKPDLERFSKVVTK